MSADWWGISIAKFDNQGNIIFHSIREPQHNKNLDMMSVARLLWREEALAILEKTGHIKGLRSKPRSVIYKKLSTVFDQQTLGKEVREAIFSRIDWRSDAPLVLNGG
jgi:hypothetical protein